MNIEIKDGVVLRDGDEIGTIKDGVCRSDKPIAPRVKAAINEANGDKLTFEVVEGHTDSSTSLPATSYILHNKDEEKAAPAKRNIPPPPATHPMLGQKDPAYVAWFKEHHSAEEFERKYGGKKLPTMEEWRKAEHSNLSRKLKFETADAE